jgi:hypothetical protein
MENIRNQPIATSPVSNQLMKIKPFKIRNGPCFTAHSCAIAHECQLARDSAGNLGRDIHDVLCQPQQYVVTTGIASLFWWHCLSSLDINKFKQHCCPVWLVSFMDEVSIIFAILAAYDDFEGCL